MKANKIAIIVILIIGTILRLYNLESFSLSNDELSIITGVKECNSFEALLAKAVKPNGHTAFLAIFIYFWGKLFGWSVIALRIPFVLFGALSIGTSYLIGKKWFNPNVGIAVAGLVACLEFSILNSQIVRPYSPGLLFYLLFVYSWSEFLFFNKSKSSLLTIITAFTGALAASIHYFCAISVGITGIVGLYFLNQTDWKNYLKLGILGVVLFSPNLAILFKQLEISGTVGWLGYSSPYFMLEHIYTIFNNSSVLLLLCLTPFVIWILKAQIKKINKFQVISIAFFILPYLFLLTYELAVQPAIVSRYIYFSFPFLLIFLLSFIQKSGRLSKTITLLIVVFSLISTTVFNKTYSTFHYGEFKRIAQSHSLWEKEYGKENISGASLLISENYLNYYFDELELKNPTSITFINRTIRHQELLDCVNKSNNNYFVFSWSNTQTPTDLYEIILRKYPHIEQQNIYYSSAITLFSKEKSNTTTQFSSTLNYIKPNETYWHLKKDNILAIDSTVIEHMDKNILYSSTFETAIENLTFDKKDNYIVTSLDYKSDNNINPLLVLTITREDETILWRSANFKDYYSPSNSIVFLCSKFPSGIKSTDVVKIFVWNNSEDDFTFNNFTVKIKKQSEIPSSSYFF